MAFPEVIIATHVYNEQNRLPRLLDSLIVQDYPNLTVFISENHSKGNIPEILKSYSRKLSMIIVKPFNYLNQIENFFSWTQNYRNMLRLMLSFFTLGQTIILSKVIPSGN